MLIDNFYPVQFKKKISLFLSTELVGMQMNHILEIEPLRKFNYLHRIGLERSSIQVKQVYYRLSVVRVKISLCTVR